jgi:hypothetical protein
MPHSNGSRRRKRISSLIRYLLCQAEPGMFNGEFLVRLTGLDPENPGRQIPVQMLVDQSEVEQLSGVPQRDRPVTGWVKVTLAKQHGSIAEVVLPQPAQPVGESLLVEASDLVEVAGNDPLRPPNRNRT